MAIEDMFPDLEDSRFRTRLQIEFAAAEGRYIALKGLLHKGVLEVPEADHLYVYWEAVGGFRSLLPEGDFRHTVDAEGESGRNIGDYYTDLYEGLREFGVGGGGEVKADNVQQNTAHCLSKTWGQFFQEIDSTLREQGFPDQLMEERWDYETIAPHMQPVFRAYVSLLMQGYNHVDLFREEGRD